MSAKDGKYLSVFKLKEAPFEAKADARYLYLSKSHARAKAYLESVISDGEDLVVISGEEGSGWTVLAVDRATRRWAVGQAARQLDAAEEAFERL